jgi:hypothetical protein
MKIFQMKINSKENPAQRNPLYYGIYIVLIEKIYI